MAQRIELAYNQNTLRLELAAMEYTDPEMNRFRVWLSKNGDKADTVELGTQNFITYANLSPGTYRFRFTACNSEGIWQETPRELMLNTPRPIWQAGGLIVLISPGALGWWVFAMAGYNNCPG